MCPVLPWLDLLERRMPDGGAQFPDPRPCYAVESGKIRVQWKLRVSSSFSSSENLKIVPATLYL